MKRIICCVALVAVAAGSVACSSTQSETTAAAQSPSSSISAAVAAVPAEQGLKNTLGSADAFNEQVVGADVAAGTYRVTGNDCTYLVRASKGGQVISAVTLNDSANANVNVEIKGSTVEITSGCAWRLLQPAT